MLKKNFVRLAVLWFFISLTALSVFFYVQKVRTDTKNETMQVMANIKLPDAEKVLKHMRVESVVADNIEQKQELVTMDIDLSGEVLWDESYTDDWFKKTQKLTYYATGKYSTDLNQITKEDLAYDHEKEEITVCVEKPSISSIEIDEMKTLIEKTDNGFFRFGEIQFEADEFNQLVLQTKEKMREEMLADAMMKEAQANTEESVRNLFTRFLENGGFGSYIIKVDWIQQRLGT